MRKIYLFVLFLCSVSTYAFQTTLTSSIYITEDATHNSLQGIRDIPTGIRRVCFINRVDDNPEIETALTAAEYIFSNAMDSVGVELVNIEAEVLWGDAAEFALDEVSKVDVFYTDNKFLNPSYPYFDSYQTELPVLIPQSVYNQCIGVSQEKCMQIKLNPEMSYYFGIESVPGNKIDAITILLRSLAIGCGIQSTLIPDLVQFGKVCNQKTYVNLFDTQIYNDLNAAYCDVVTGQVSEAAFLGNRIIYADGYSSGFESNLMSVRLHNDWEDGIQGRNVTSNTLNTVSSRGYTEEEDQNLFYDILDADLGYGIAQRTVTPYTMALLQGLGWRKELSVGFDDDLAFLRKSTLHCSSTILRSDQTYQVWLSENASLGNFVCKLQAKDSMYVIATGDYNGVFSFHTIPEDVQWKRNPITKNIIGQIQATAYAVVTGYVEMEKTLDVEIPYKPNRPIVQKTESATDGNISLHLNAFANGSNTYTVTYTGITYNDTHTFTTTATALDTILTNIPGNQLYDLSVYGANNEGNSASYNFTFGFSARPPLNMTVSVSGNVLKYDLSNNGTVDISNVVIESVRITNQAGVLMMVSTAGSRVPIDISSLPRGSYVITVLADNNTYSRTFTKR